MPVIYKQRDGFLGDVYKKIYINLLNSGHLSCFICHSSEEKKLYPQLFGFNIDKKIIFVPCGIADDDYAEKASKVNSRYFFSGGTSNRDYKTLINAFREKSEKLKIACNPKDVDGISIPANVEILCDMHGNTFLEYMRNAYAVIIPINDHRISSGQLVLLQAMSLCKPIIVTKSAGVTDYVNENCAIFVEPHSINEISEAVTYLVKNVKILDKISKNANKLYKDNFTIEHYGKKVADIINKTLCKQ